MYICIHPSSCIYGTFLSPFIFPGMILDCWGQRSLQNRSSKISSGPSDGARKGHATSKRPRYAGCFYFYSMHSCVFRYIFIFSLFLSRDLLFHACALHRALALRLYFFLFLYQDIRRLRWKKERKSYICIYIMNIYMFCYEHIHVDSKNRTVRALALRLGVFLF